MSELPICVYCNRPSLDGQICYFCQEDRQIGIWSPRRCCEDGDCSACEIREEHQHKMISRQNEIRRLHIIGVQLVKYSSAGYDVTNARGLRLKDRRNGYAFYVDEQEVGISDFIHEFLRRRA